MTLFLSAVDAVVETNAIQSGGFTLRFDVFLVFALTLAVLGAVSQTLAAVVENKKRRTEDKKLGLERRREARRRREMRGRLKGAVAFWGFIFIAISVVAANRPAELRSFYALAIFGETNVETIGSESVAQNDAKIVEQIARTAAESFVDETAPEMRDVALGDETVVWRGATSKSTRAAANQGEESAPLANAFSLNRQETQGTDSDSVAEARKENVAFIPYVGAESTENFPIVASESTSQTGAVRGARAKGISGVAQPIYRESRAAGRKIAQTSFEPAKPIVPYPINPTSFETSRPVDSNGGASVALIGTTSGSILEQIDAEYNLISDRVKTCVLPIETRKFANNATKKVAEETGCGFLTQYDGRVYLITNRHVVVDATSRESVRVFLPNKKVVSPLNILTCSDFDLAALELNPTDLPKDGTVSLCYFGDSDELRVGNFVGTVGNPFGLENTVTNGRVSSLRRRNLPLNKARKNSLQEFIQIDGAINPGNSGGPLYNSRGEVVGVVTAIATTSGKNEGVAFAIPINLALEVVKSTIDAGGWRRSHMGVELASAARDDLARTNLSSVFGAKILNVQPGSPAASAGLRVGDVVLTFNGENMKDDAHLARSIALCDAKNLATMQVWRDSESRVLEIRAALKEARIAE